jgi:soluble lytic murein transglycosylase-like protein
MRSYLYSFRVVLLGGLLLYSIIPTTAKADQIVVLLDDQGHRVYVNTGGSASRVEWMIRSFQPISPSVSRNALPGINQLVEQTAHRLQMDPELIRAIVRVESGYNSKVVSNKGAVGLMQLIPATAKRFGVENPFDPKQNLEGGVNYLKYLMALFGGDLSLSLAAYNAGERTVQRSGGIPAIAETQNYVRKVKSIYQMGDASAQLKATANTPPVPPISRYVDQYGVVHFTNVD